MLIKREKYLQVLINSMNNGFIKVLTGIRRCGKTFILLYFFYDHLIETGVAEENIIVIPLDDEKYREFCDSERLYSFIREKISDGNQKYYVLIDEAPDAVPRQGMKNQDGAENLHAALLRLNKMNNVDIYLTGSNGRFFSSYIKGEFQSSCQQIHVAPLSFTEFCSVTKKDFSEAWEEYKIYGGLPHVLSEIDGAAKSAYLEKMCREVYLRDICERYDIRNKKGLESLLELLASKCGEAVNPQRILDFFKEKGSESLTMPTIANFLVYLQEAFVLQKSSCREIKGRKEISTQPRYYFSDLGIRNAFLRFKGGDEAGDGEEISKNISKNVIFNELIYRGFGVESGVIETRVSEDGKKIRRQLEIDFVAEKDGQRFYIQTVPGKSTLEKLSHVQSTLLKIPDSFKKIIVVNGNKPLWRTEQGITVISMLDFIQNPDSLNL